MKRIKYFLKAGIWSWIFVFSVLNLLYLHYLYPSFKPMGAVDYFYWWSQWALLPISLVFAVRCWILATRKRRR